MGRRIYVRWDLTIGPRDLDLVVTLPERVRFTRGELRPTLAEIRLVPFSKLERTMNDPQNWVGLLSHFDYERALSGYIAAYPHHLEDGLLPYPNGKVRERVFQDKSRLDVLLQDRDGTPVIVECKQAHPTLKDLKQLRHYLRRLKLETRRSSRGILVHGGTRKLRTEVKRDAAISPKIEIVRYTLDVDFAPCE